MGPSRCYTILALSALLNLAAGDLYLHNPRGNNNRNSEKNENRNNANRIFDSQNNGKGGYPRAGDPTVGGKADPISYIGGTKMDVTWTNQHACNSETTHCTVIIQYQCDDMMPGLRDGYPTGQMRNQ